MHDIPSQYTSLASTEQVDEKIHELAARIHSDHQNELPLFVALLRGAAPFASKLMLELTKQSPQSHPEIDYMMVSTYGSGQEAGEPHIVTDLAPTTTVRDRAVIVIDDVLDKGITADFVSSHLRARGAAAIQLAVLCDKQVTRERDVVADYVGFEFGDNWLVGMGMDDANAATEGYRWLQEIWEITR